MLLFRPLIDDGGTRRPVAPTQRFVERGSPKDRGNSDERYDVVAIGPAGCLALHAAFFIVIIAGSCVAVLTVMYGPGASLPPLLRGLMPGLLAGAFAILLSFMARPMMRSVSARVYAMVHFQASRCPSCAFSLEGLEPDDEQRVTCPECSAVWYRTRIGP
ncbi:MAG: hypothetical protein AAFP26_04540 [Planctomycetota bacterium]